MYFTFYFGKKFKIIPIIRNFIISDAIALTASRNNKKSPVTTKIGYGGFANPCSAAAWAVEKIPYGASR